MKWNMFQIHLKEMRPCILQSNWNSTPHLPHPLHRLGTKEKLGSKWGHIISIGWAFFSFQIFEEQLLKIVNIK